MADRGVRWPIVAVLVAVALVIGFGAGTWRSGTKTATGRVDTMADGGGSIITADWTYGFGSGVTWIDAANSWHDNGIPDCLPPGTSTAGVHFAWTEASVEGLTWRPVVWIDCRNVVAR